MSTLADRRLVVTGGSSGIGAAVATLAAASGAAVAVVGRDRRRLDEVSLTTGAVGILADVGDPEEARRAVDEAADHLGGLDAVVNSAGLMVHSAISAGRYDDWEAVLRVNVLGLAYVSHAALSHLRRAGFGDVVNVASLASDRVSHPDLAMYAASKAAVARLTDALRSDVGEQSGIRVSMIKPGATRTPGFGPGIRDPELREQIVTAAQTSGMEAEVVATQICHMLALPRTACITEMTLMPHIHHPEENA